MSAEKRIQGLVMDAAVDGIFPGAVLLVSRHQKIIFFEAAGNASLIPTPRPMTRQTRFDLASLTKPLATALAVLYFVSQKKVHLDASLPELLPLEHLPADKHEITLRQLLCHCSGLPAWKPYYLSLNSFPRKVRKTQIRQQILAESLVYPPATQTLYSDLGFILIEWILERISGQRLHRLIRRHLFGQMACATPDFIPLPGEADPDPNEFAHTEYCEWRGRVLTGQVHDENAYVLGGVAGHAGLFGTALEVKCVLDAILDTFTSENSSVSWSRDHLAEFLRPAYLDPSSTWGLGFDTPAASESSAGQYFSAKSVGHLGFTGTSFWLDLEKEIAVILLTNRIHPTRSNETIKEFRPLLHDAVMEEYG